MQRVEPVPAGSTPSTGAVPVRQPELGPRRSAPDGRRPHAGRFGRSLSQVPTGRIEPTLYVTIPVASAMTGYSAKAIRRKIECRVWIEGREFRKAPDGHVLISLKGYQQWVERGRV